VSDSDFLVITKEKLFFFSEKSKLRKTVSRFFFFGGKRKEFLFGEKMESNGVSGAAGGGGAGGAAGDKAYADSIMASINQNDDRKLFVGSLAWETQEDEFCEYFAKYGSIKEHTIKKDEIGRSKGFGFILFEEPDSVDKVLAEENHSLGNRKIQPKKATPKERVRKIFVGGVSPELAEDEIRKHFEQFGEIESMELPVNKDKKGPSGETIRKGFCFITFKDADACDNATAKGKLKQELGDRSVDVKKAVPQEIHQGWGYYARFGGNGAPAGGGRGGGRGGQRGGRGGYYGPPMDPYMYGFGYGGFDYPAYGMDYGYSANYAMMPRGMPRGRGRGGGRPF